MIEPEAETLAMAFFAHIDMEETIRYLAEGRRCAHWDDDTLESRWLSAWKDFLVDRSEIAGDDYHDTSAELRLRRLTPPWHRISAAARQQVTANAREARKRPEMRQRIAADISRFFREWEKPRN